ncbi:HlyD family secretion protein [Phreatobacter sp.]|uniref:HlyD family secretion protein n=1 Tax=Phreatobacter sp. TaxID=1966341 RepID=UPI0025D0A081|nr:HlyD family secretion protein [Phreatobacter sp.]
MKRPRPDDAPAISAPTAPPSPAAPPAVVPPVTRDTPLAPAAGPAPAPPRKRGFARFVLAAVVLLALAVAGRWGWDWWVDGRFLVVTDDAYVRAEVTTVATKISGYVAAMDVRNGDRVRAGDVIARLDDGDFRLAVEAARNRVETQRAAQLRLGRQVEAAQAGAAQAATQIAGARAEASRAQSDFQRFSALAASDFASRSRLDQARAERERAIAAVAWAEAALVAAQANVEVAVAQREEGRKLVAELETTLARAERDLGFTLVKAPFDGVIGNKAVQAGDFVQPGARLAALVPLDRIWVEANFKETQLARLQVGQRVRLAVDALPDRPIEGRVESFSPASGAVFSLLPPENATGNFTKIVQRVPVRIAVAPEAVATGLLRPGLSVVVRVETRAAEGALAASPAR